MEPEGDEDVINWDDALEEIGDGEWEFVLDMVSELYESTCTNLKIVMSGCLSQQARGDAMDWDEFILNCQEVHRAAHSIKGAAKQIYCAALGNAAEVVEHPLRLAREIKRDPSLAETKEDRASARVTLAKGMASVTGEPIRLLVVEARKFAVVVAKLDQEFLEEEAGDEVLARLDGAGVEQLDGLIADEMKSFGWAGDKK